MPPKNNNTSWWSSRQQAPETPTRETPPSQTPTRETRNVNHNNEPGPANAKNSEDAQTIAGMADLIEFINALAAVPLGTRPQLNPEQVERIKKSPLRPVVQALQPIYRKIVEANVEQEKPPEAKPPTPQPTSTPEPEPSSAQQTPKAAALD
ncbi:hypothetical protein FRC00_007815, partial [Tulasnella sp. 408]